MSWSLAWIILAYLMAIGGATISLTNENNFWWWYGLFLLSSSLMVGRLAEQQTSGETTP